MNDEVLNVKDLSIEYITEESRVFAVNHLSFSLDRGKIMGLVGETGAGKTTTALGILRLIPSPPGKVTSGDIVFEGQSLSSISEREMRKIRGKKISMIFQDPMTALNPVMTVGEQIAEVIRLHEEVSRADAIKKAQDMMELVGIPGSRHSEYPHQFSGGMKQRVVIAIALACNPELLIADEPTTALDVTIQAQVLELVRKLQNERGTSMILITHDLGVVAEICDTVGVMYAGELIEYGTLDDIFNHTRHPYTKGLFESIPDIEVDSERLKPIKGLMPDPSNLPSGCSFHPRCPYCQKRCMEENPACIDDGTGHTVKCFYPLG